MTTSLPTDTYYRGYRLSCTHEGTPEQTIDIYANADHIERVFDFDTARADIDAWHLAR